jgi:hypothetical protein
MIGRGRDKNPLAGFIPTGKTSREAEVLREAEERLEREQRLEAERRAVERSKTVQPRPDDPEFERLARGGAPHGNPLIERARAHEDARLNHELANRTRPWTAEEAAAFKERQRRATLSDAQLAAEREQEEREKQWQQALAEIKRLRMRVEELETRDANQINT